MNLSPRVVELPAPGAACPAWLSRDSIVDWVGEGGAVHQLDGRVDEKNWRFNYHFDATVLSPSGHPAIIHERHGTKGIVIDVRNGTDFPAIREINRSYYFAHQYEFPVTTFTLPDGRDAMVHCPCEYNRLDIEVAATGELLTGRVFDTGSATDFFHSRLSVNRDGTRLLSAGWCWQPFDTVMLFDIDAALRDPSTLDGGGVPFDGDAWPWEVNSACFLDDRRVVISSSTLADGENKDVIGTWDAVTGKIDRVVSLEAPVGTMMPIDGTHVLGFFDHPKLVNIETGRLVQAWTDLSLGPSMHQLSSLSGFTCQEVFTRVAIDPVGGGFAFLDPSREVIVAVRWD